MQIGDLLSTSLNINVDNASNLNTSETTCSVGNPAHKKQRIVRYLPKDALFELTCEFDDCRQIFNSMDVFLAHTDNHLNDYFAKVEREGLADQGM